MNSIRHALNNALLASTVLAASFLAFPVTANAQDQNQDQDQQQPVEEIVVLGRFIPDEKRATSEIANLLDAEDFTITGDSDIASALQRVTGLSLVGDGFVYVRGLGERYSKALLNGAELPSPLPLQRVVPLDIFPTDFIESVLVQKTYSPQYPSEFGGGVIELRTKAAPDEGFISIGVSGEYDTNSTFKNGLSYDGGGLDLLGIDTGHRRLPDVIRATPLRGLNQLSAQELEAATEEFPNIYSIDSEPNPVNFGLNLSLGNRFELNNGWVFGVIAAVDYDSNFTNKFGQRNTVAVAGGEVNFGDRFSPEACEGEENAGECGFRSTEWDISLNGIFTLGLEFNEDHSVKYDGIILRNTTREALITQGIDGSENAIRSNNRLDWVEQQTLINQLSGEHFFDVFNDSFLETTEIRWHLAYSEAKRDQPLRRDYTYELSNVNGGEAFLLDDDTATLTFSGLDDQTIDVGFDATQSMLIADTEVDLRFGMSYYRQERDAVTRTFRFRFPGGALVDLRRQVPEIIFQPANIGPGQITLIETSTRADAFDASLENWQGFAMLDIQLLERLRLSGGFRVENSLHDVDTAFRTLPFTDLQLQPDDPINVRLDNDSLLPAATVTWEFADNMQFRLGYSQTLGRPSLRELSPASFLDPERDAPVFGNPTLNITEVDNYDIRWEWYFGRGESITIGAFYKDLTNPIERTFVVVANELFRSFINGDSAELIGVEAEVEKNIPLGDWLDGAFFQNRDFFIKANGAYIDSETTISGPLTSIVTNAKRRLQGQSEILANAQIGWENLDNGERVALLMNYTGKRISDVGLFEAPDQFEKPPISVGLTYSRDIELAGGIFKFSFEADNLIGDDFILEQGGLIVEEYKRGRTFKIGVKATY